MSAPGDFDRTRLSRLLGMLGSEHDGEALNAGRLADRFVRDRGLTWSDVLHTASALPPPRRSDVFRDWPARWRGALLLCLDDPQLDAWSATFCANLASYRNRPSPKQLRALRTIAERVLTAGGVS